MWLWLQNILKNKRRLCERLGCYELWSVGVGAGRSGQHFWSCFWAHGNISCLSQRCSAIRNTNTGSSELHRFPFHKCDHREQTHIYCILPQIFSADDRITTRTRSRVDMIYMHEIISSSVQSLGLSQKTSSSSAHQDEQSNNCMDFCLSHASKIRFMYASQDLSLVRHLWRCCRASTCTAQRSPGCRTGCVCDKHTVNKAGKCSGAALRLTLPPPRRTPSC